MLPSNCASLRARMAGLIDIMARASAKVVDMRR
jgi:hypothetical protein